MKKSLIPTILILVLSAILCVLIAKGYRDSKRATTLSKIATMSSKTTDEEEDDGSPVVDKKRLTTEDTCIVISTDLEEKEITLRNVRGGEDRILKYDNLTRFATKYDSPLTAAELMPGDIVDVTFTTHDLLISSAKMSDKAWEMKEVKRFSFDEKGKNITIGDELYRLYDNSVIASGEKLGKTLDITGLDMVTVRGIDKMVYSIQVEKGHGYIRIKNDSYFVGGWIEVGQDMITIMTENMLIPIGEGTYDVKVTNKGYVGKETVNVKRDKETILDLSKVEIEEVAIGHVLFTLNPDYAQLYVDGIMTDYEERVPLEYGIHSIRAELAGYETVHANIRVGSENANISIELDEVEEVEESSSNSKAPPDSSTDSMVSPNSSSYNAYSDTTGSTVLPDSSSTVTSADTIISDSKQIYVEGPSGCEVYLDGSYIGIAPCKTLKVTGDHTITLSKSGYETKSYTISVANDGNDLTMSFSELTKTE